MKGSPLSFLLGLLNKQHDNSFLTFHMKPLYILIFFAC